MSKKILITGAAGFIGFHLAKLRLEQGDVVHGIDNLNDYYDVSLKEARLVILQKFDNFSFQKINLEHNQNIDKCFAEFKPEIVVNLAAQAGVRYSIENPLSYINSNIVGFNSILEACRHHKVSNLVYASSSSVYGANSKQPFSENDPVNHPLALYAATKKSNELMAHAYSSLYNLPTTGLRFFTVYGPWGRPDMALFKFTKNIFDGKEIDVYNHGDMIRDFTFIDDIVMGVSKTIDKPAQANKDWNSHTPEPSTSYCPYQVYNIGNNNPVALMDYVRAIEKSTGKTAKINYMPMQEGDVPSSHADVSKLERDFNYSPNTSIENGVEKFVQWYREYYL